MIPLPLQDRPQVREVLRKVAAPTCYPGCDCRRCCDLREKILATIEAEVRREMAEENTRLRAAIEDAYREGYNDGIGDGHPLSRPNSDKAWVCSDARALLRPEGGTSV